MAGGEAAPIDLFVSNTNPASTPDIIRDVLVKCAEISANNNGVREYMNKYLTATTNTSFIGGIQEHFKKNNNTDKYKVFVINIVSHISTGFCEPGITSIRPKGGLALILVS